MNAMSTLTLDRAGGPAARRVKSAAPAPRRAAPRRSSRPIVRGAAAADAPAIHRLLTKYGREGRLLPRTLGDVTEHANRFLVATVRGRIVGCVELAPLGPSMAEVRSFVVTTRSRGFGLGRLLIDELRARGRAQGFEQLCAFTHTSGYFARLGFAIVPHAAVPEKIAADCRPCLQFGSCGQHAMVIDLAPADSRSGLDFRDGEPQGKPQGLSAFRFLPML
jgi:amino-acid N-acetyltransferase